MARRDSETSVAVFAIEEQVQRTVSSGEHTPCGARLQGSVHAPSRTADVEAKDAVQQRHQVVAHRASAAVVLQGHDDDDDDSADVSRTGGAKSWTLCVEAKGSGADRADNLSATAGKREKKSSRVSFFLLNSIDVFFLKHYINYQ